MLPATPEIVDEIAKASHAVHARELSSRLGVTEDEFAAFMRILDSLCYEGRLIALPGHRFKAKGCGQQSPHQTTREGVLTVNPRGFGFVASAEHPQDDVFIDASQLRGSMHGDKVRVRVTRRGPKGVEGEILEVTDRTISRVAGTLRRRGSSAWIEPDDSRIRGPITLTRDVDQIAGEGNSGNDGDAVIVRITKYPVFADEHAEGALVAVLGRPGELNVEVAKILAMQQIGELHSDKAVAESEAFGSIVPEDMKQERLDLRHIPLPTIDPEDARDHDDAVWVERTDRGGYRAWIAIADVSSYVRPGTALDTEAMARGCSVYLPDRAIPMLPRALSSNLCSLLPGDDRLCLCAEVELDGGGSVIKSTLHRAVMHSQAKLTYGGVAHALGLSAEAKEQPEAKPLLEGLRVAHELSRILRGKRMKRGALDLELPEPKVILSPESNKVLDVQKRTQDPGVGKAYQLIEELMLLANEVVAAWLTERKLATVYRVHAPPDLLKLERLTELCELLGIQFDADATQNPKKLGEFLKSVSGHQLAAVISNMLLRSLKQATYDTTNIGHFGLASPAYLHFTSPIRRYPDLLVHRGVHRALLSQAPDETERQKLTEAAVAASQAERKAMEVERAVLELYRAHFMRDHIGEHFTGVISSFVGSGAFITINIPFVDVLVRTEDMGPGNYEVDDLGFAATDAGSGDRLALGDSIEVSIVDVNLSRRTVYARRLLGDGASPQRRAHPSKKDKGRVKKEEPRRQKKGHAAAQKAGKAKNGRKFAAKPPKVKRAKKRK